MMKNLIAVGLLALCTNGIAKSGQIDGHVAVVLSPNQYSSSTEQSIIHLPKYHFNNDALAKLKQRLIRYRQYGYQQEKQPHYLNLPRQVVVGMNSTPVLDQGRHGSCVTFAVTGAINATLGVGNYISQLCNLELGKQLVFDGKAQFSGWDGNYASNVFSQIDNYGIVPISSQQRQGCAGIMKYPLNNGDDTGNPMSTKEFKSLSVAVGKLYDWKVLMFNDGWLIPSNDMNNIIYSIKQQLAQGNLLTFGVLLDADQGHAGALGSHHVNYDTWMLTPEIIDDGIEGSISAGHDMIITGYDDDAIVSDDKGNTNKGIFYLRNSWSSNYGDKGNYYMSYDYFKLLSQELHLIKRK